MKGTKPRIVLRPGLLQLDVVADDADDVRLLLQRFFEVFRGHGWFDASEGVTLVPLDCEPECR